MLCAGNIRQYRAAAGGDSNMIGSNTLAVNFNGALVNKAGKTFNIGYAIIIKAFVIAAMNALDISVAVFTSVAQLKLFWVMSKP